MHVWDTRWALRCVNTVSCGAPVHATYGAYDNLSLSVEADLVSCIDCDLQVLQVALDGLVKVPAGQVNGAHVANLPRLQDLVPDLLPNQLETLWEGDVSVKLNIMFCDFHDTLYVV